MVSERMEGDQLSPTEFKGGDQLSPTEFGGGGRKLTANQLSMSGGGWEEIISRLRNLIKEHVNFIVS